MPQTFKIAWVTALFVAILLSFPANSELQTAKVISDYITCLNSRKALHSGRCTKIRNYITENSSHAERSDIVDALIRKSGVTPFYDDGVNAPVKYFEGIVKPPKKDTAQCKNNKNLHGYYDPSRRVIVVCSSNLEIGSSYLTDHVVLHEIIHAAQHCYGGTLSSNPTLKALYFSAGPEPDDLATVIELYPKGQWVNEIEARAGLVNGLEIDYGTLLYLSCKTFKRR